MVNYIRMDYLLSRFNKRSEFMNLLDRLERKFGKFAIKRLPMYIVILNLFVYMLNLLDSRYINYLYLIPSRVLKGEIWRLVTYIFIPPMTSMEDVLWLFFAIYFYYIMATGLENEWGSFKFNLYYLLGMIGTTIAAFFIPLPATANFINLSIFLAFAYLYPDYQIYLFFIIPIKIKYLGYISWILIIYELLTVPLIMKFYIIIPILNFFIFFGKDIFVRYKTRGKSVYRRSKYMGTFREKSYFHKCTVCGVTEKDNPDMEFRYCMTCEGHYEYCMEHLKNHEHIKK
jgi:membrane associated rhomboid family serine protease